MRIEMRVEDCRDRFAAARVARLATADSGGRPHLVPVTFALLPSTSPGQADELVVAVDRKPKRSNDLKRLRNIRANQQVCLLVDHYADDWSRLWWVRADGEATVVERAADRPDAIERLRAKYAQYVADPLTGPLIVVAVRTWRGWVAS